MSRISNNSFKVNSALEQMTEISAVKAGVVFPISASAALDQNLTEVGGVAIALGSTVSANSLPVVIASDQGTVDVSDSIAQGSLSTIASDTTSLDTKITSGTSSTLASAQQAGIYGWDGSSWRQVAVNATGSVKTVSTASAHTGTEGNLDNAASVVSGDTSTVITPTTHSLLTVFGNTTGSSGIIPQVSADGTTYYPAGYEIYPDLNGDFFQIFSDISTNNFRLKYQDTATVTATVLSNA
tara:strand:+ start:8730 stop:9449 length:720 start_codon:yes stop_codon:yes gene_type:complete